MSIHNVIENGFCIGCGACKSVDPDAIKISFYNGVYNAKIVNESLLSGVASKVCPFSDDSANETDLVKVNETYSQSQKIGQFTNIHIGGVVNNNERELSSSGGMTSWVLSKLLDGGYVDLVIHVIETKPGMFEFSVVSTVEEITLGKKSKYYPVCMDEILLQIDKNKSYAITGVPCFIKSIKLLQKQGLYTNIKFTLALFCGHYKSSYFSEMLSWELGVKPDDISNVDFRKKIKGHAASDYFVQTSNKKGQTKQGRISEMFGTNWAHGLFKPKACDFCDDICGELADVTFGDAWLTEYTNNWLGTNVVISRNEVIDNIINKGLENNEVALNAATEKDVVKSQAANFRHRRGGILSRLKTVSFKWTPTKRLDLCEEYYDEARDYVYKRRWELSKESSELFSNAKGKGHYIFFKLPMYYKLITYDLKVNGLIYVIKTELRKRIAKLVRVMGIRKDVK